MEAYVVLTINSGLRTGTFLVAIIPTAAAAVAPVVDRPRGDILRAMRHRHRHDDSPRLGRQAMHGAETGAAA